MSLDLAQLAKAVLDFRGPLVDLNGRISADFKRIFYGVVTQSEEIEATADAATTAAATAQTAAESAAETSSYAEAVPTGYAWNSDPSGTFPASNPSFDITVTFYNQSGTQVGQRVLRGTLTSASGTVAITNVSSSASTGYSTAYTLTNDGTSSALATVTLTLPGSNQISHSVAWNAIDLSTAGGTPATGGGK